MKTAIVLGIVALTFTAGERRAMPRESWVPVDNAKLYSREIGHGQPIVILHGGPDFDSSYFLPEMDRLSDEYRLIYYDERGRGKSAEGVKPEDVTIDSEMADLDKVRAFYGIDSPIILGHSWGSVLALEYAIRHPDRASRLILMNPAPATADDFVALRKARVEKLGSDLDRLKAIAATDAFKQGKPDAVAAYYRIHFKPALMRPADLEKLITRLQASFTEEGVLKARAIEARLFDQTWFLPGYSLLPQAHTLSIPTLVIYSDHDFIPAETAAHIAGAIPNARLVTLKECGHFPYMECPRATRKVIHDFLHAPTPAAQQSPQGHAPSRAIDRRDE